MDDPAYDPTKVSAISARQGPLILLGTNVGEVWIDVTQAIYVRQSTDTSVSVHFSGDVISVRGEARHVVHLIHAAQLEWSREVAYEQEVGRIMALDAESSTPPGEAEPNP